jgi:D-sedoheptulose 7-phosphate isomerase
MSNREILRRRVVEAIAVCEVLLGDDVISAVDEIGGAIVNALRGGGKLLLCGNGGSAADAQHLAAELVGRFMLDRRPLAAIALGANVAAVTAIGNDYRYEEIFVREVRAIGAYGDVLIGLSTSGSSPNVVSALQVASELGLVTVALVGEPTCAMAAVADHVVSVPGPSSGRIQEGHMIIGHVLCEIVEAELCRPG